MGCELVRALTFYFKMPTNSKKKTPQNIFEGKFPFWVFVSLKEFPMQADSNSQLRTS